MNHDHYPGSDKTDGYHPRHDETDALDPTTMTPTELIDTVANRAPNENDARLIRDAFEQHGGAYAVYLSFTDTDRYSPTSEADFRNAFVHTYRDRDGLIEDTIDDFGWRRDLDRRLDGDPLLRAVVSFDRRAIWDFVRDHYKIIDTENGLHVFEQDP